MIIFGFRGFAKVLAMLTLVCNRCGNPAAHRVTQISRWFTLFFIPVFPISFKRMTTCTFCGTSTKITKEQAQQMVEASQSGTPQAFGPAQEQLPQAGYPQQASPQQGYPQPGFQQPGYAQPGYPQPGSAAQPDPAPRPADPQQNWQQPGPGQQ